MSQTKLGPTLQLTDNEKHETHSFWFENFQCSVRVDRRKDGQSLAVTLQTPSGKVVVSLGPQDCPRFIAQVKHVKDWNDACEYSSEVSKKGAKFRLDYEPGNHA
jgi:hypothetical protein